MTNVEFKAELRDPALCRTLLARIHATKVDTLEQTDTYFRLTSGRLKRRETAGHPTEYIFYHRENQARPRLSKFTIYSESQARRHFGMGELPQWVRIVKSREVYMHGGVRIHIDDVQGLGSFIEFEALLTSQMTQEQAFAAVELLRTALLPVLGEMLSDSYADMSVLNS